MAATRPTPFPSWLRWFIGLALPGLMLAGLGLVALYREQRTQWGARKLGEYLLEHNADRPAHGAVWQGILASRQTRSQLQEEPRVPPQETSHLPKPILQNRYWDARRSDDFLVLSIHRRAAPLRPSRLSALQVQELARSLQVYQQGKQLLAALSLAPEPYQIQARIRAQTALEDSTLFPLLHQRLLAADAPAAWDFVEMSEDDRRYWKEFIAPLLAPAVEGEGQPQPETTDQTALRGFSQHDRPQGEGQPQPETTDQTLQVTEALHSLVQNWADSLRQDEIRHLQKTWETGPQFQLRIVRTMDTFTGYAVIADAPPIPFEIPAQQAEDLLGLAPSTEDEP